MTDNVQAASLGTRLPDLIALAQETAPEKRRALLRELTDRFFGTPQHGAAESEAYGAVLSQLTDAMEKAVRAELAERFAPLAHAPSVLVNRLAHDEEPGVASPVLEASPVLTDEDLLAVIRRRSQGHMQAVSRRQEVSEAVSDAIVEHGNDETLGVLLANDRARLSRQASEAAVDRARLNPGLHEVTVNRASLPPDLLNEMYFVVEARLRQKILEQNARLDPVLLDHALAAGRTRIATEDGSLPPDYAASQAEIEPLRADDQLTPQTLAGFLRSGQQTHFISALAQLADVDFHTVRRILTSREIDALAVVCKAADLDRALFLTYAVVLLGPDANALGKARTFGTLYQDLTTETAQRTLRFWRLRSAIKAA